MSRGAWLTPRLLAAVSIAKELEELVVSVTDSIKQASVSAVPLVSSGNRRQKVHWWTSEIDDMRITTNKLRNRIRNANSERRQHVVERYLEANRAYKEAIQEAITQSWRKFCER